MELLAPPNPSPELLKDGDTIPLKNSSAYPTTEQTLASLSMILRGGGIPNLEVLQNEVYNIFNGRGDQIRAFLGKLDTFTDQLNQQRDDITHAIDSTNRLLAYVGQRADVLDRVLTDIPPLIKHFADTKNLLINAVDAVGQLCQVADQYLSEARGPLHTNLQSLQCPLNELGRASPYLIGALKLILTQPYDIDTVPKIFRGDYQNISLTARRDLQLHRQRVPHRHRIVRRPARARAVVRARSRDDDPRRPLHAEPERRARRTAGGKGGREPMLTPFIRRQLIAFAHPDGDLDCSCWVSTTCRSPAWWASASTRSRPTCRHRVACIRRPT